MHPFVFFSLALYSLSIVCSTETNEGLRSFSIDLIHNDSPLSPFYNPSLTRSQRIINIALTTFSQLTFLDENNLPETLLFPDKFQYLIRYYIGTPPVERLARVNTGSDLIWVQCSPCKVYCFPQNTPLFEPDKSSTFTSLSCNSQPCTLFPPGQHKCGNLDQCLYSYQYGDKSFTVGTLGTETLHFGSITGANIVSFPNKIFGCGVYNNFTFVTSEKVTGVVGLGAGPLSLVSQLGDHIGHKFSYCLLPFDSTSTSKLKFGSDSIITTNDTLSTPLIIKPSLPSFYFLNLESITIGQKIVQTGQIDGNIIIASGTPMTFLEPTLYYNFEALLQEALGIESVQDVPSPFKYCFAFRDHIVFPHTVFQFTGASVALKPTNLFLEIPDIHMLCLAVVPSPQRGISIFGSFAQYDFQVGYDLEGKTVSFIPADCTKI
ncbi:hypothetical protein VNO78_13255 [Psophocarpus tetragonolobus]|uniref:Peptidase A1 domain-containing protein n=1 Tax=Psophocarpus tetragonolobus TaxID=3891 RepID=A0AAN9XQC9_PSOTE